MLAADELLAVPYDSVAGFIPEVAGVFFLVHIKTKHRSSDFKHGTSSYAFRLPGKGKAGEYRFRETGKSAIFSANYTRMALINPFMF